MKRLPTRKSCSGERCAQDRMARVHQRVERPATRHHGLQTAGLRAIFRQVFEIPSIAARRGTAEKRVTLTYLCVFRRVLQL